MRQIRRKDRVMEESLARELLKNCEYAVLATVNEDGSPYCVAVSPVLAGDALYFHCALEGQKFDNLRREPRVCLTCVGKTKLMPEKLTTQYESAVVYGEAEMIEDEAEKIAALRIFSEKYTPHCMDVAEAGIQKSLSRTGVCKVSVKRVTGKQKTAK